MLKVKTANTETLERLIDRIRSIDGVARTETMVVLSTHTERTRIALRSRARRRATQRAQTSGAAGADGRQPSMSRRTSAPADQGLYDPGHEHDACGVGFVANISGERSHDIVAQGHRRCSRNLEHRGACGCDPQTGDGAGILIQLPDAFLAARSRELGIELPAPGRYARRHGLPRRASRAAQRACASIFEQVVARGGPEAPRLARRAGRPERDRPAARASACRAIRQVFVGAAPALEQDAFERKLYVIRKRVENADRKSSRDGFFYVPSLSTRTSSTRAC